MPKHTPGPWVEVHNYWGMAEIHGGEHGEIPICKMLDAFDSSQNQPNIALIKASPEMFEALIELIPHFESLHMAIGGWHGNAEKRGEALKKAKDAIMKVFSEGGGTDA